ncbi:MAG: hypothetical protein ACTJLK_02405 [Anaplasma sp.]
MWPGVGGFVDACKAKTRLSEWLQESGEPVDRVLMQQETQELWRRLKQIFGPEGEIFNKRELSLSVTKGAAEVLVRSYREG